MTTESPTATADTPAASAPGSIPIVPILAMMLCVFALGSAEYAVIGLLPDIARDLGSTVTASGWIVTVYAVTVQSRAPSLPRTWHGTRASTP